MYIKYYILIDYVFDIKLYMNLYIRYNVIKKWIDILFNIFGLLCCFVLFVDFRFVEIMDFCIMLFIFF